MTSAAEGILVHLLAGRVHRRAYRAYELREHSPTSSLVGPGLVAVVAGLLVEGLLTVGLGPVSRMAVVVWLVYVAYSWLVPPLVRRQVPGVNPHR